MSTDAVVRFGVFADAHYAQRVYGDRHCDASAAKLAAAVEGFGAASVDFVVCLGDLIDSAPEPATEIAYARTMAGILAECAAPRHFVLGNHDVAALTKAEFAQACGAVHPWQYSFDVHGIHFVVLDGNCHEDGRDFRAGDFSWDQAWVAAAQIDWLRADLAAAGDRPTVVMCHENLDDRLWQDALDPHVVRDAAAVRAVLQASASPLMVLQAHYHPGLAVEQEGIPYVALRAMVVGEGLANNAWGIVQVHPDGTVVLEGHGQQPSWVGRRQV